MNPIPATMEADPTRAYNQADASDFIRFYAVRLTVGGAGEEMNTLTKILLSGTAGIN